MSGSQYVNFASPANRQVLTFLHIDEAEKAKVFTPKEVNTWHLGTHPDLVDYLWNFMKVTHPECCCVINERSLPLLAHPVSGVLFGLAGGTGTLAFRLPEPERTLMMAVPDYGAEHKYPNSTTYARSIGEDWVLLKPFDPRNAEMVQRAYSYAETLK
jgi:hypothetical protein